MNVNTRKLPGLSRLLAAAFLASGLLACGGSGGGASGPATFKLGDPIATASGPGGAALNQPLAVASLLRPTITLE